MAHEHLFTSLIENTDDIVIVLELSSGDEEASIIYVNAAFENKTSYTTKEIIGESLHILEGPDSDRKTCNKLYAAIRQGKSIRCELLNYSKNKKPYWVDTRLVPLPGDNDRITHIACIQRDTTKAHRLKEKLTDMTVHDELTGALNRRGFFSQANKEFKRCKRYYRPMSVIMIDIDHFKLINDEYGHQIGDNVLKSFTELSIDTVRGYDSFARIGGEEFALMLPDTNQAAASFLAERIRQKMKNHPFIAGEKMIEVTASFGVAGLNENDEDFENLLQRADKALYEAKESGRDQVMAA